MNDDLGVSADDSHTSSPATHTEPETAARIASYQRELDEIFIDEDTIVWNVHAQEPHLDRR